MMDIQTVLLTSKIAENAYENICNIAEDLKGGPPFIVYESEEYYNVPVGRLWMKMYPDSVRLVRDANEIYMSMIFPEERVEAATKLREMLKASVGCRGVIIKMCKRYVIGQTRIHIDQVADLGVFVKIAVICESDQSREDGEDIARAYQNRLGITDDQRINYTSYIDLLAPRNP